MPAMNQDLLAVGKEYQYTLMDQADFLSCKQYRNKFRCKDVGKDLASTCIGAHYLQELTSIQEWCQFNMVPAKEYTFKLGNDKWKSLLQTPIHLLSDVLHLSKPSQSRQLQSLQCLQVAVCLWTQILLNSVDNEFKNKHYKWFWDSDVLFPKYNSNIFGEVLRTYSNKTAISIQFLNQAVTLRENIKHTNDTVKTKVTSVKKLIQWHQQTLFSPLPWQCVW